jgi:predicted glycosyltransferase
MERKKILISPLNWGFGHAGRMLALAQVLKGRGQEVIFGADRNLIPLLQNEMPGTEVVSIPGVRIRYSRFLPQYLCIFLQLPQVIYASVREHAILRKIAASLEPDIIISDSRFGLFHREIVSVYITHQLRIVFPSFLRFLERPGAWIHRRIIRRFDLCLIPDYPGPVNLSGRLSHYVRLPAKVCYMGPLSRFLSTVSVTDNILRVDPATDDTLRVDPATDKSPKMDPPYCCLILSGPEPQRSLLLKKASAAVKNMPLAVLTVTPLPPGLTTAPGVTVFTGPGIHAMISLISRSEVVITRAGYTSVMELASLGRGAVLIPTPGQTEQEYLGKDLNGKWGFVTVKQQAIARAGIPLHEAVSDSSKILPDSGPLLKEALALLFQQEKK